MTLNILVSFSLLALVVTARPISNASQSAKRPLEVQNAVQAFFASRTGRLQDSLACEDEDVRVSFTTSEEQTALLSSLKDFDTIKAVIPLDTEGSPSEDEKQLYALLKGFKSTDSLDDIDGDILPFDSQGSLALKDASESIPVSPQDNSQDLPSVKFPDTYSSPPVLVLAVSSIAALLAVLCVGVALYAYNHVNALMTKHVLAWDVLLRVEQRIGPHNDNLDGGATPPENKLSDAPLPPVNIGLHETLGEKSNENDKLVDVGELLFDDEDLDEKFHDAPETSLLFLNTDVDFQHQVKPDIPRIVVASHADPDLLPLPDFPTTQSTPFSTSLRTPLRTSLSSPTCSTLRGSAQMREVQSSPTLLSKPLWSLRAADAPTLGLPGTISSSSPIQPRSESPVPQLPGALFADDTAESMVQHPRQGARKPRQPLDIAFALQLRPGLGLGADSAWLVRFLMAMFGWMTFFVGGGPRREDGHRALTI